LSQFLVYADEAGRLKIDVRLDRETVWLTQQAMAELLQTTQQNISFHVKNVYTEGELDPEATHKDYLSVRIEGGAKVEGTCRHSARQTATITCSLRAVHEPATW
jgi:hypothetical protein